MAEPGLEPWPPLPPWVVALVLLPHAVWLTWLCLAAGRWAFSVLVQLHQIQAPFSPAAGCQGVVVGRLGVVLAAQDGVGGTRQGR